MKLSLFALLAPFLAIPLAAQVVIVSDPIDLRPDETYHILGHFEEGVLIFKNDAVSAEVAKYDSNLKLLWEREVTLMDRRPEVMGVVDGRTDFTVLYSRRVENEFHIVAHRYDLDANLLDTATVKNMGRTYYRPEFTLIRSEDRSKVAFYQVKNQQNIQVLVFDLQQLALLWEHEFSLDQADYGEEFRQILVDNDGNFFFISSKDNRKRRKLTHYFEYYQFGQATNFKPRVFQTSLNGKLTYDVLFSIDNLNKLLVAGGLYGEDTYLKAEGYYFLSVSPDRPQDYVLEFEAFSEEFVNTLLRKKKGSKNKGITETNIQEVVHRSDGGALIIGERNRVFVRGGTGSRVSNSRYNARYITDYFYDDLFVISVHPDGKTHWNNILHKKQYSQDDDGVFSSYFLLKTSSALRLLFNDEIKYENTVSEYVLRGSGEYDRNSVMNTADQKLKLRFQSAVQIAGNSLIVPSERRNKLQLVKVLY